MDANFYYRVNVAAVKKVDPTMINILDSASHVAMYTFNSNDNKWEKTEIEGAMFLYSRTSTPEHAFIIMNRLSTQNLVEPVTSGHDFQIKEPYLLYKTPDSSIFGIWFYDKDECYRMTSNLQKLVKTTKELEEKKGNKKDGGVDIFSMLSKAQEDFNTRNQPEKSDGLIDLLTPSTTTTSSQGAMPIPIPQASGNQPPRVSNTPQSVMDFFAKAGNTQYTSCQESSSDKVLKAPATILPGFFQQTPTQVMSAKLPSPPEDKMKPILMRIMSNPAHSVEHIEKQQRAVTPESKGLENGIKFLQMSPVSHNTIFGTPPSERPLSVPLSEKPQQPALIPPGMFSTPSRPEMDTGDQSGWMLGMSPNSSMNIPNPNPAANSSLTTEVTPLTRNQLLQAISYLIKHDPEFVNKLHEAYVKSFNDLLS